MEGVSMLQWALNLKRVRAQALTLDPRRMVRAALVAGVALLFSTGFVGQTTVIHELFGFPCNATTSACPDGATPGGTLVQASDGNFYGTTTSGGAQTNDGGTVFRISPSGQFTLLHTFAADERGNFSNGNQPVGSLVEGKDGFLYGVTTSGGTQNAGVIFKIGKTGVFNLLHTFCSEALCADGSNPTPLVLGNDGNLYGGTLGGGLSNNGSIFRITPGGAFTTLHALNNTTDGGPPSQALVQASDGNFYGVGSFSTGGGLGNLFRVTPAGQFADLHDFGTPPDADPNARVIQGTNGLLYGTTFYGEIFQVSLAGSFQIVVPGPFHTILGGVTQASDGNLWATHSGRGVLENADDLFADNIGGANLLGVAFECSTTGGNPQGVIQGADGKLYGVAALCGVDSRGQAASGTVFTVDAGLAPPKAVVAILTPASGKVGSQVTIRGEHFVGTTAVAINGVKAAFKVLSTEFIGVTVPAGANTGPITVTNAGGTTKSKQSFNVD